MAKRITELTSATVLAETDLLPVVDISDTTQATSGTTKKSTLSLIADYLKARVETLTNKTLTSPLFAGVIDGWISAEETWTYASADDPTYTFTVAADVTTKYSVGMRIKLTQTTVKYFIITAVSTFSGGNTTITVYGGTDYDLANAAITSPYYSMVKAPFGFPMSPDKWSEEVANSLSTSQQDTPTQNVWYNAGSISLSIPIGLWSIWTFYNLYGFDADGSATIKGTLSTAGDSESNTKMTTGIATTSGAGLVSPSSKSIVTSLSAKTTHYLNVLTINTGVNGIGFRGDRGDTIIRATCAYL